MPTKHVAKVTRRHDVVEVARDLLALTERLDFPIEEVFTAAGLALNPGPSLARLAALNRRELSRIFEVIVLRAERVSCASLNAAPALPPGGFQMMCLALTSCPTLGDAVETARRFFDVFTQGGTEVGVRRRGEGCWFFMDSVSDQPDSLHNCMVTLAGLHSFAQLFSWLIGHDLDIEDVSVRHKTAVSDVWVSSLLAGRPNPHRPSNGFSFRADRLESRVVRSYAEFMDLSQFFPFDLMPPNYDGWLLAERVQSYYLSALHRNEAPRLPDLAAAFNVSLTTLRRRLAEENRSFQRIKDDCRRGAAEALLSDTAATLEEISDRLAFSDVANFRRSFIRWTGVSPTEYRKRCQ